MDSLAVSVIIPVYRDWNKLATLLKALAAQDFQHPDDWEILVVDNDDQPSETKFLDSRVRIIHEPKGFSYAARNAGVAAARGRVLVFTDADCIPEPEWLRHGLQALENTQSDIVGGAVDVALESPGIAAIYDRCFGLKQDYFLRRWSGMATANLFVHKHVFATVGSFRADLISGGDFEFCRRAAKQGYVLSYAPDALVRHPARRNVRELMGQNKRHVQGQVDIAFGKSSDVKEPMPRLTQFLWRLWRPDVAEWYGIANGSDIRVADSSAQRRFMLLWLRMALYYHRAFTGSWAMLWRHRVKPTY